ncbi:MAG: flavin-nucleotide-binding protein [Frankiales bacterium]|nr:flavin-nucleotide-binding protein [Frankiales bacterium]
MSNTPVGSLLGLSRRVMGGAVGNARGSWEAIACAVTDRRQLCDQERDEGPGALQRLSAAACLELLASGTVGRLAYVARAGVPDIVPVNYVLKDGAILIRSGPGPKLQAAERRETVAFEVEAVDPAAHAGWSVVVTGRAERLRAAEADRLDLPVPWANGVRRHTLRIQPRHVEGRRLL